MKSRLLAATVALVAMAALSAPGHAASGGRVEERAYEVGGSFRVEGSSVVSTLPIATWGQFESKAGERKVIFEAKDQLGTLSMLRVLVDRWGDGKFEMERDFCDSSADLKIKPHTVIYVVPMTGTCRNGDVSIASNGTIVATFLRN